MKTFMFLVTVWTADGTPPTVYVEDYNLSGSDCIAAMLAYNGDATPSCEIEVTQ